MLEEKDTSIRQKIFDFIARDNYPFSSVHNRFLNQLPTALVFTGDYEKNLKSIFGDSLKKEGHLTVWLESQHCATMKALMSSFNSQLVDIDLSDKEVEIGYNTTQRKVFFYLSI